MKTKKQKILKQIELQEKIQQAGFNIVNCGNCGSVVLHECNEEDDIDCLYCDEILAKSDCPDFLYTGLELSEEFKDK
jgi:ribosomal protein S27E